MSSSTRKPTTTLLVIAWTVTLLVSALPGALWAQFTGSAAPQWIYYIRIALPLLLIFLAEVLPVLYPLRTYFLLLAVVNLGFWLISALRAIPSWRTWEAGIQWLPGMFILQALEVGVALLVLGALFLTLRKRAAFWFQRGDLKAMAEPVPWIGMTNPTPWKTFGLIVALAAFFGGILFLSISNPPDGTALLKLLPLLPGVILLAAVNALDEEIIFRSGLLAPLAPALGSLPALYLTSVFFGIGHYSGTFPGGLIWLLLTSFLGFLFGKSMQETKGLFWPWLLHFISDIPVFAFTALAFLK